MDYVDLNRLFIPLTDDEKATEWGPAWGQKYGGWLSWDRLLEHKRVALLAEASSGKSTELKAQVRRLRDAGKRAFFVPIEELADDGFQNALSGEDGEAFLAWKSIEASEAWFFLDSVDEARLNDKKLTVALRKFTKELTTANLWRAHVLITCRASDWKGKSDRKDVDEALPYVKPPDEPTEVKDRDAAFLSPLFSGKKYLKREAEQEPQPSDLLVVQLAPLSDEQKLAMAKAAKVSDLDRFLAEVHRHGLDTMTERPGDLEDVIEYWKAHGRFESLAKMTEEGVKRKLREIDGHRPGPTSISEERARLGAERLAAGLVLGKSFTLKAPSHEGAGKLKGSIEPSELLPDWDQKDVNDLLRRGLFAPATYGRIRFHHRSSQENLAACWLQRLLSNGCPESEIRRLLFVERYGVKTVVPALRAIAAWLALWQPWVRNEIIRREPVSLIAHGDPKSLSLQARTALLASYASLDAKGLVDAENIDSRAAWMFSSPDLADAVRAAWDANDREGFRLELLGFIEEGQISACCDLAAATALNSEASDQLRVVAARALSASRDETGLRSLATKALEEAQLMSARLAPQLAAVLFPEWLSVQELLLIIGKSAPARPFKSEGFDSHLEKLYIAAPSRLAKRELALGVANLCLKDMPRDEDDLDHDLDGTYPPALGKAVAPIALLELESLLRTEGDDDSIVRILMAAERGGESSSGDSEDMPALKAKIAADSRLNRELMWADCAYMRQNVPAERRPKHHWQVGPQLGSQLWSISASDAGWLEEDARHKSATWDRQVAFSGLITALMEASKFESSRALLEEIAGDDPALQADLAAELAPRAPDPYEQVKAEARARQKAREDDEKKSWLDARETWTEKPERLSEPAGDDTWGWLYDATTWIKARARERNREGAQHWLLLAEVTSAQVAEHYARGMRRVWRLIPPERPVFVDANQSTTKGYSRLAIDALQVDSVDDGWESTLSDFEAEIAIKHALYTGNSRESWVSRLLRSHPHIVAPQLEEEVVFEYTSDRARIDVLNQAAYDELRATSAVTKKLFELFQASEPADESALKRTLKALARGMDHLDAVRLEELVVSRLRDHLHAQKDAQVREYLSLYAVLNPDAMAQLTIATLAARNDEAPEARLARQRDWIGALFAGFGRQGSAVAAIDNMSAANIAGLLQIAEQCTANESDDFNDRNSAADSVSTLFNALASKPGAEAFYVMRDLPNNAIFVNRALRCSEVAHSKAAADGDLVPWTPAETHRFGTKFAAPAKSGAALWELVESVIEDFTADFDNEDASSRSVLALAQNENQVQTWLEEQLKLRSMNRYHAHREPEVADKKEPDIVLSSTAALVEVAVEVKNGNMDWSVPKLEDALRTQLATRYLRPKNRRHGILVITMHTERYWLPEPGVKWMFGDVISHLSSLAESIESNDTGAISVSVLGIDATDRRS
jgi:hypothetical protein